ncbi:MAG: CdaR family protein [Candidatus Gracilibacteria bacterium]
MKNFLLKNWHVKILSLIAASVFWFFVLSSVSTFFVYPTALPIETFNVPENLAVVNALGDATFTVRADQEIYKNLTSDNFTVYVDLKGLVAGEQTVNVSVNSKKTDVGVVAIDPIQVVVVLEELQTKEIPIEFELQGKPDSNYTAEWAMLPDLEIEVSGAESVVEDAEKAVAILILTGTETEDVSRMVEIKVYNAKGQELGQVTTNPKTVELDVTIEPAEAVKTVGIKVNTEGEVDGYISQIQTIPDVVQIQGDADLLEDIDYLETEPIFIEPGQTKITARAELILPDGVSLGEGESSFVEVEIEVALIQTPTNLENNVLEISLPSHGALAEGIPPPPPHKS